MKFISLFLAIIAIDAYAFTQNRVYEFVILHTNDHHGHYWRNDRGEYGMAARKTLIDKIRKEAALEGKETILLSGGDINTGVPESDLLEAKPDFLGMNMIGYDAVAIGNHEFDKGRALLDRQIKWAEFPMLSANVFEKSTGKPAYRQSFRKTILGDLKLNIVGFTTEDTGSYYLEGDLDFRKVIDVAKENIHSYRAGADLLIAVTHMGHYSNGQHGTRAPGDISLARAVPGFDFIIGGHTQKPLFKPEIVDSTGHKLYQKLGIKNPTTIVQAYEWGKYVGRMDVRFINGKYEVLSYKLIPVNLIRPGFDTPEQQKECQSKVRKEWEVVVEEDGYLNPLGYEVKQDACYVGNTQLHQDSEILKMLAPFKIQASAELDKVIGHFADDMKGRPGSRVTERYGFPIETNLGRFAAESICKHKNVLADVCFINNGGLRIDIPKGFVSYNDLLSLMPFNNQIVSFELTFDELVSYVKKLLVNVSEISHLHGLEVYLNPPSPGEGRRTPSMSKIRLKSPKAQERARNSGKLRIATVDYLGAGGSKYPDMSLHPSYKGTGVTDAMAIIGMFEHVKKRELRKDPNTPRDLLKVNEEYVANIQSDRDYGEQHHSFRWVEK